jgi:hypothetical protein
VTMVTVGHEGQTPPWSDFVVCGLCSRTLLPLTFAPASIDDVSRDVDNRPDLKCPGCGRRYQWRDSAGWAPL